MEIPYRNTKLLIQTIPKGTLLFRAAETSEDSLRGVPLDDSTRCIIPNFNVYFYPNPFVAQRTIGEWLSKDVKMFVFILKTPVKVIRLINPAKQSRTSRLTKRNFIKPCDKVPKGCMPNELNSYDACVSDTIVKKYPDVVGLLTIPFRDAVRLKKSLKKTAKNIRSLFKLAGDARGVQGIPELVLHPLTRRPDKTTIIEKSDKLDNNYKLLSTLDLKNEKAMLTFMDKHAVFDPETFFYTYTA